MNRRLRRLVKRAIKRQQERAPWHTPQYRHLSLNHAVRRGNWIARQTTY